MVVSTPLGKNINIDEVYKGVKLYIKGVELRVDLMPLELHDFDLILEMDWLNRYRAQVDCFTKTVTLQDVSGKRVVFRGEKRVIPNSIISVMTAGKLVMTAVVHELLHPFLEVFTPHVRLNKQLHWARLTSKKHSL
jgi:hypothetical protein